MLRKKTAVFANLNVIPNFEVAFAKNIDKNPLTKGPAADIIIE